MKKTTNFFPGKTMVSFRKGPSGHLRHDPSDEAMRIKKNPSLQDKSPPQRHDLVKTNALTVVFERGGDVSDRLEVMGEYVLQFGKYKGKLFRWLLENDVGYTIYLMKKVEEEERDGTFNPQGHNKDSLLSFLDYARSFQLIRDLREYLASRLPAPPVASEGENTVGFGARAKDTWRQIWESRADGYAAFIVGVKCIKNSKMYNLQQYILKQQRAESGESCPPPAGVSTTSAAPTPPTSSILAMEEDEELERGMLNLSPYKFATELRPAAVSRAPAVSPPTAHRTEPTATVSRPAEPDDSSGIVASVKATTKAPLPVPPQLLALAPQLGVEEQAPNVLRQKPGITSAPFLPEELPSVEAQRDTVPDEALPSPAPSVPLDVPHQPAASVPGYAQDVAQWNCSHQQKIWMKTELETLGLWPGSRPVASSGIGRPRVIIGTSGQYYILASRLTCKACRKYWHADKPQWLEKLPERFSNIVPAFLTHKKAICKSVMDEMMSGRSPEDMAKQLTEALHLKYEKAHLAYLLSVQNIRDAEAGVYGQRTITGLLRQADTRLHSVATPMLTAGVECLFLLTTWSTAWSDCCAAFTVLDPGHQEHLLWDCWRTSEATVAKATSGNLANNSASRSKFNKDISIKLDLFHCMRRFTRECVSEHHPLFSSFCQFLSAAFVVVDQRDLQRLTEAYTFCGISPANQTKQHIREHCRTRVPQPRELLQRVEDVLHHFYLAKDANDVPLFMASMLKLWRIQRVHILRGCLSDPDVGEGILYRRASTFTKPSG
ncbi:uncharacterized protein LOC114573624 [Perca flavescens]|uniref:uncharacterized protein LOC114573624 n=1 Tax=Perca flavescens TaxID=8167 RepID=UPI00106E4C35|nr:uncharacterized protein LOC114573624 [Perca flavescens]